MNDLPDDLQRALEALDARAAGSAARVDAERVAVRVLERLRTEPALAAPARRWRTALRVAAAVAVLATGTALVRVLTHGDEPAAVASLPVELPESLDAGQVAALMDAVAAGDSVTVTAATVTVDDLNEAELRALLQAMQSDAEGAL